MWLYFRIITLLSQSFKIATTISCLLLHTHISNPLPPCLLHLSKPLAISCNSEKICMLRRNPRPSHTLQNPLQIIREQEVNPPTKSILLLVLHGKSQRPRKIARVRTFR